MSTYEARSSQFGLISGIHQPQSDLVLVAEPRSLFAPEARKGQLYIVAEAEGDVSRGRDACQLALRLLRKHFYDDSSYSITAALRKAILATNKALYENNFSVAAQKRAFVGVTCAVIKDNDVYVAQVLPSQAYLLTEGKLRALPTHSSWNPAQTGAVSFIKPNAIGASLSIEPDFYRATLRADDTLLLCTSNLSRTLTREDVDDLVHLDSAAALLDELTALCKEQSLLDAHGIAVKVHPLLSPEAEATPLSGAGVSERGRLAMRGASAWVGRMSSELVLLLRGPAARAQIRKTKARHEQQIREQQQLSTMTESPDYPTETAPRPRSLDLGESIDEHAERERIARRMRLGMPSARPSDERSAPPSTFLGEGHYQHTQHADQHIDLSDTPGMAALGRSARPSGSYQSSNSAKSPYDMSLGERILQPFEQVYAAVQRIGQRRKMRRPPPSAMPQARRQQGLSYRRQHAPPFSLMLFLLLVLLVALLLVYGKGLADQNTQRAADTALAQAEQAMAAVRAAADNSTAEQRLSGVGDALAEIRASGTITATQENRLRYEQLEQEYERALASIQKLTYFSDLEEVARHPLADGQFSSVVVAPPPQGITDTGGFGTVYLLDTNIGALYSMPKAGGSIQTLLRPDETIGNAQVGNVKSQAWRVDNVIAVAQSGEGGPFTFYFRNGAQWSYSNLAGSSEWGRVGQHFRAVNYEGNLYIWGAVPSQVLKYTSGNYGEFPQPWIQNDAGHSIDGTIDIAVDGKIYLLQTDGRVLVFSTGAFDHELAPKDINPPLVTPASFYVTLQDPDHGSIFLVDTNNERIIQIDKQTGTFIQQVRARPDSEIHLNQLTSLYVDESSSRLTLYLVNGGQILRASLPDPPRPFRESTTPTPGSSTPTATP